MRLKTLNINDRSESFSPITSELIKKITGDVNKIGLMFDKFIEIETFIMMNVVEEFEDLVGIRSRRKEIELNEGNNSYINNYFKPSALVLEKKINEMTEEWNLMNDEFNVEYIIKISKTLKKFKIFISNLNTGLESLDIINKIIDDFGRFQSIGCLINNNIVDKIESLLRSKENILKIREKPEFFNEINIDDFSIDDL